MPNWVTNSLSIEGDEEQIKKLKEQVGAPYERNVYDHEKKEVVTNKYPNPIFSFWNICRPPDDKLDEYEQRHGFVDGKETGHTEFNWYNFNNREWGTKWDVANVDYQDTTISEPSPTEVSYGFQTAWSPPEEAIQKLSAQYPDLEITLEWEEEQGFGAIWVFQNGESTTEDEWDIPNSHADYVKRDNEDGCACAYSEDENDWYSDCPNKTKPIELHEVREIEIVGAE